jgi:hypothetical protein
MSERANCDAGPSSPALYVSGVTSAVFERQVCKYPLEVHMLLVQNRCSSQFPLTEYADVLPVDLNVKIKGLEVIKNLSQ